MRVATVNYYCDIGIRAPEDLLARYPTLSEWAEALAGAGAETVVIQRFPRDAEIERGGIRYRFVRTRTDESRGTCASDAAVIRAVAEARPDVVHVHGLRYARPAAGLARRLRAPVLVQDHADHPPRNPLRRAALRRALREAQGVSFAADELAFPWREAGLIGPGLPVFALMESSSRFRLQDRAAARAHTGLTGAPLCLWVGRLNDNKDPLTVLDGFAAALRDLPEARLAMAYGTSGLLPQVRLWLDRNPRIAPRVALAGTLPHAEMEAVYNSADLFLLGSHHEGSGYAVLEALACGVTPVVTDIPSFRRMLAGGAMGALWPPGDSRALARALLRAWAGSHPDSRRRIRAFFETRWSFEAIGRDALAVYRALLERGTL